MDAGGRATHGAVAEFTEERQRNSYTLGGEKVKILMLWFSLPFLCALCVLCGKLLLPLMRFALEFTDKGLKVPITNR